MAICGASRMRNAVASPVCRLFLPLKRHEHQPGHGVTTLLKRSIAVSPSLLPAWILLRFFHLFILLFVYWCIYFTFSLFTARTRFKKNSNTETNRKTIANGHKTHFYWALLPIVSHIFCSNQPILMNIFVLKVIMLSNSFLGSKGKQYSKSQIWNSVEIRKSPFPATGN